MRKDIISMYNFVHPYIPLSVHFYFIINTGKLEIVNDVPKDINVFWPICGNDKSIYFIDRNYQSFVLNRIYDTCIYRLKNKKIELLFKVNGGIVSYDVIPN